MELYIVRHGQTDWNKMDRLQGLTDIELNANGRQVAIELGDKLENEGVEFDAIYSSPLIRAYETASLIRGRQNIRIIKDERLHEIGFGVDEGVDYKTWLREDNPQRVFFTEPGKYFPPEGGESIESVCKRGEEFLREVIEPQYDKADKIMIVAHGAMNKGLMAYLENNDKEHFWGDGLQNNCEADVFEYDGNTWCKTVSSQKK
ncbi:MAG: histidine phosphatase family protein [Lachnospiraceae bacterium]|nr:histidine phosphatase family protein [Lachnospiraceae bacterium]